jgi:hypothetical protein
MDLRPTVSLSPDSDLSGVWLLPALVQPDVLVVLQRYVNLRLASGTMPREPEKSDAYAIYGDPVVESLFELLTSRLSALVGTPVEPSYGYLRVYLAGADLAAHIDREACEYTLSVAINGMLEGAAWALHARDLTGAHIEQSLAPGDAILMRGREVSHWRETLESGWAAYAFLHWVRSEPTPRQRFDGRPGLGFSSPLAPS